MTLDRREFLLGAGALAGCGPATEPGAESAAPAAAGFARPLGAQLYTLRFVLPDNPAQVLKDLAAIGYTEVEVLQNDYPAQAQLIRDAGLKAAAMHLRPGVVLGDASAAESPQKTVAEAAEYAATEGIGWLVMPYLAAEQRGTTLDHYKALGEKLNRAGEQAKAAGLGFAYHNHAFEFEPLEGSTPLDAILENSDPQLVQLELDVFWVALAGLDPVERLRRHTGRVALTHLKDKAPDAPIQFKEGPPKEAFREVGSGDLDFVAILRACEAAGVRHYFVEQDQTPGDPLASLRKSYEYVRSLAV